MQKDSAVGEHLPIQCPKHQNGTVTVQNAVEMYKHIDKPNLVCSYSCDEFMPCHKHKCQKICLPMHRHDQCKQLVKSTFPKCGHDIQHECYKRINDLECDFKVPFKYPNWTPYEALLLLLLSAFSKACLVSLSLPWPESPALLPNSSGG